MEKNKASSFKLSSIFKFKKIEWGVLVGIQILLFTAIYSVKNFHPFFYELQLRNWDTLTGRIISYLLLFLLAFQVSFLIYIVVLYLRYKPTNVVDRERLPFISVIVPAYNEGEQVYHTLHSILQSDYPKDKLQVIAIDDGSTDDTWSWMYRAYTELNHLNITVLQQAKNQGKRHALHRGFLAADGDVFVTIDSDSVIKNDTLAQLVSPFVEDENCGAVAGNVKVLNKKQGIIPRMLNVSFVFSFEFVRAAQSSIGLVLCTPGALSAYRKEAVMNCLKEWLHQKFAGQYATIGEDRAMTNMILKQGYKVLFQKKAIVLTNTPISYRNLHRMFTRWGRSNVRETLAMRKFVFTKFKEQHLSGARFIFIHQAVMLLMAIPLLLFMLYFLAQYPIVYLTSALLGTFIWSSIQMLFFSKKYNLKEALWAYPYNVFYMFTMFWIMPFSIATVRNGRWLTR